MAGALVRQILSATERIQCWSITSAGGLSASIEARELRLMIGQLLEELLLTAVIDRRCSLRFYLETGSDASCASRNSSNDSLGIEICCPPLAAEIAVPAPAPRVSPSKASLPPPATPPIRASSPAPCRPLLAVLPD